MVSVVPAFAEPVRNTEVALLGRVSRAVARGAELVIELDVRSRAFTTR